MTAPACAARAEAEGRMTGDEEVEELESGRQTQIVASFPPEASSHCGGER